MATKLKNFRFKEWMLELLDQLKEEFGMQSDTDTVKIMMLIARDYSDEVPIIDRLKEIRDIERHKPRG